MISPEDYMRKDPRPVHGYPMVCAFSFNWERIEEFQCREDDVWLISYPKSGSTWMSEIMDLIKNDGDVEKQEKIHLVDRVQMLELVIPGMITSGSEKLEKKPSPRYIKSHLPTALIPKSFWENKCKVVYVARNAKDVAVSYYYFEKMSNLRANPGTFAEYLEKFMSGQVAFGSWHEHVTKWWEKKKDHPILYLFYEDLKEDPKREIQKLVQFLGKKFNEETLDRIVQRTSFETMKNNPLVNCEFVSDLLNKNVSQFMRKGITGDWKNHFTVAQNEKFDEDYKKKMDGKMPMFRTEI